MKLAVLFLLATILSFSEGKQSFKKKSSSKESSEKKKSHYQLFSTLTAYDTVRGDILRQPGCKPTALWAFFRHGTRYPYLKEMDKHRELESFRDSVLSNHYNGEGKLDKFQLKLLRKWGYKGTKEQEMFLTTSGYEELIKLGKRLHKTFPGLLDMKQLPSINMKRTSYERTRESAAAVTQGMFGMATLLGNSSIDDSFLKTAKKCPFWSKITKSAELKKPVEEFKNSSEMQTLIRNVNKRLGFRNDVLTFDTIKDIYNLCGYESSWYPREYSTWCSVFSTNELQIMEYLKDLTYYWKSGFGNNLISKLGCELVDDMIKKLDNSDNLLKTTLYFGHASGIRELLVSLGIGKCLKDLLGNGYISPDKRGNCWRTSQLNSFSSNVIAVLYSCKTKSEKTSKIGVYVNEKIVKFPFCNGQELCDFETFKNSQSSLIDKSYCNKDFCLASSLRSKGVYNLLADDDGDDDDDDDDD